MDTVTEATEARLAIGGNNPPGKMELERAAELTAKVVDWNASRPAIEDSAEADAAQGFVDQLRASKKDLAAAQKVELAPLDEAVAGVKAKYRGPLDMIEAALKALLEKSGAWIVRERKRVADEQAAKEAEARRLREEADRLERERLERERIELERLERERREAEPPPEAPAEIVAAKAAETEAADIAVVTADTEARLAEKAAAKKVAPVVIKAAGAARAMTLRAYWSAVVTDEELAMASLANHATVRKATLAAALQVANELARTSKSEAAAPAGFRFIKDERAA